MLNSFLVMEFSIRTSQPLNVFIVTYRTSVRTTRLSGRCIWTISTATKCNVFRTKMTFTFRSSYIGIYQQWWYETDLCWGPINMGRTRSTALERPVIPLLRAGGGWNRFYGIPNLALGLDVAHTLSYDLRQAHLITECYILIWHPMTASVLLRLIRPSHSYETPVSYNNWQSPVAFQRYEIWTGEPLILS